MIVNPAAGSGQAGRSWDSFLKQAQIILGEVAYDITQKQGDATLLARRALVDGYDTIIAVGGDGTINEVVNGFFQDGRVILADARMGIIPMGTGGDLVKTLGGPKHLEEILLNIKMGATRKCDLGCVTFNTKSDQPSRHYFVNIADAGFGGTLVQSVNGTSKVFGPFVSYLTGLLRTLATYKNSRIRIQVDNGNEREMTALAVVVANGQFFGGGMWVAPQARLDDGLFDIVIIGDISKLEVLKNIHKLYNGSLLDHPEVTSMRAKKVSLAASSETFVEADGEWLGLLPAQFEIQPAAIDIISHERN